MMTANKLFDMKRGGFRIISFQNFSREPFIQKRSDFFTIIKAFEPIDVVVDQENYQLRTDQMMFIGPGRSIDLPASRQGNGCVLNFTAEFYERSIEDTITINSSLFFGERVVLHNDFVFVENVFNQHILCRIERARLQGDHIFDLIAHHCIESLLLDAYHSVSAENNILQPRNTTDMGLVNHFSMLIHQHCREYTHVQFYADQLRVTTRKLTEVCLAMTGKTAKSMILSVLVQHAVRFIKHTNLSISQISYEMGFNDESNFRNFVKKQTGHIPLALRQN